MVWTDSVYANSESPPIKKKEEKRKIISSYSYLYKKSS